MYEKRLRKLRAKLELEGYHAFVLKQEANIRYLCCTEIPFAILTYLIVPRKGSCMGLVASLEKFRAKAACKLKELFSFSDLPWIESDAKNADILLAKVLASRKITKVLADSKMKIKGVKVKPDELLSELRKRKDSLELVNIEKACRIVSKAEKKLKEFIVEGITELEAANELDYYLRKLGAQAMAFPTIIASGKHSCYSHHHPTSKKIKTNIPVICDLGVYWKGYCSDFTRTIFLGKVDEKISKIYTAVKAAQQAVIKLVKPGLKFKALDLEARKIIKEYGYEKYFVHSTGHGIGLEVHEKPRIASTTNEKIEIGNVFTIEPGIYIPGKFGVRIEDVVIVEKSGARVLTR
jgi:Xaa-Pro aminopeptidase